MIISQLILIEVYKKGYRVKNNLAFGIRKKEPLKLRLDTVGYLVFNVNCFGKSHNIRVHRLAAYQKYKERLFEPGMEVRHLNGIKTDNSFENLCLGTHKENMLDRDPEKRLQHAIKASKFIRKYTDEQIIQIKKDHSSGLGYNALMEKYNISSKGTLHYILNRKYVT